MALSQNPISVVDNILHRRLGASRAPDAKMSLMDEEHSARSGTERYCLGYLTFHPPNKHSSNHLKQDTHLTRHELAAKSHSRRRRMLPSDLFQISVPSDCRVPLHWICNTRDSLGCVVARRNSQLKGFCSMRSPHAIGPEKSSATARMKGGIFNF